LIRLRLIQALVLAFPLALAVSACVDTVGTQSTTAPTKTKPGQAPGGGALLTADQAQKRLLDQCVNDQGDYIGLNAAIKKNCECYSQTMGKAMNKEELAFYSSYNVIPTLGKLKPDDVKRQCGIVPDADKPSRARGKLAPPPN
jgi:hypothetical protein